MTAKIIFGSDKLGHIEEKQIELMLERHQLGKLISFERTDKGAMGQTMFIRTEEGAYVFKGNPLYKGQLVEEKYFIDTIHERTEIPVPTPYIIDYDKEIFGWSYALMPLLEGEHLNDSHIKEWLTTKEKVQIAEKIATTLAVFHQWDVPEFGELNPESLEIIPFKSSYTTWLFNRIVFWLKDAKKYSVITEEDVDWVKSLLNEAEETFNHITAPTFVMGDFKADNFLVSKKKIGWEISGVFDFTNAYFADPLLDLIKMTILYIDQDEIEIAKHLMTTYFGKTQVTGDVKTRLMVHMLHQRVLDWGSAKATNRVTWDNEMPFSEWVKGYMDIVEKILSYN